MNTTELLVLDMAGTTVADDGLVEESFLAAITAVGVPGDRHPELMDYIRETRGQSKISVFRAILGEEELAKQAHEEFCRTYEKFIGSGRCTPVAGAEDMVHQVREAGIKIALTTGFAPATQNAILEALGWNDLADLALTPGPTVRGRPFPDLVLTAAMRLEITDVRNVAVAGDTPSDVLAGLRSGASVSAGVLTGTGTRAQLWAAGATHVLASVRDLPPLLIPPHC